MSVTQLYPSPAERRDEEAAAAILAEAGISWARLKDERNRAMCVLAEAGWTTREIAAVFEVSKSTVDRVLSQNGTNRLDPRGGARGRKPTAEDTKRHAPVGVAVV